MTTLLNLVNAYAGVWALLAQTLFYTVSTVLVLHKAYKGGA